MQMSLEKDNFVKLIKTTFDILNLIKDEKLRNSILSIFLDEKFQERYFSAPASHRAKYHNCFDGGLADHNLRVYACAKKMRDTVCKNISDDDIIVCSFLHDIGKLGDPDGQNYYLYNDSTWHREKLGEFYKINENIKYMEHAHRSIMWIIHYNIPITFDQYKAILIHDGQYVDSNKTYAHKEGMLSILMHQADILSTNLERENYNNFLNNKENK